jgi:hypothetical protein
MGATNILSAHGTDQWAAVRAGLDEALEALLAPYREMLPEGARPIPALALHRGATGGDLLALVDLLRHRGFPLVNLVVSDPELRRAGIVPLAFVGAGTDAGQVRVSLTRHGVVVATEAAVTTLNRSDGALPLTEFYRTLAREAAARPGGRLPPLVVHVSADASFDELVALMDAAQYRRTVPDEATGQAVRAILPDAEDGAPAYLVGGFILDLGPAQR